MTNSHETNHAVKDASCQPESFRMDKAEHLRKWALETIFQSPHVNNEDLCDGLLIADRAVHYVLTGERLSSQQASAKEAVRSNCRLFCAVICRAKCFFQMKHAIIYKLYNIIFSFIPVRIKKVPLHTINCTPNHEWRQVGGPFIVLRQYFLNALHKLGCRFKIKAKFAFARSLPGSISNKICQLPQKLARRLRDIGHKNSSSAGVVGTSTVDEAGGSGNAATSSSDLLRELNDQQVAATYAVRDAVDRLRIQVFHEVGQFIRRKS